MDKRRDAILNGALAPNLVKFGLPLAIAMGLQACFNLIDLAIIGRLPNGSIAVAALVSCDLLAVIGTIFTQGVSNAAVAIISRYFGRGDQSSLNHATWNSITVVAVLSIIFGAFGYFGAPFLTGGMVGLEGETQQIAESYLKIIVGHSWTIFFLLHLTAVMRALGDAKWPTIILIAANVLNIFLDVLFVYGPGDAPAAFAWGAPIAAALGIPRMGVDGAAWATVIARAVGVLWAAVLLMRYKNGPRFVRSEMRPTRAELTRLIRIGAPSSAQFLVRISGVLVVLSLVARIYEPTNPAVATALSVCIRLDMLGLFLGLGWGSAAATFVGMNLGNQAPKRAEKAGWVAAVLNSGVMILVGLVFILFSEQIFALFLQDDSTEIALSTVFSVGKQYLWIVGSSYAFIGTALVLSNALQGATDTMSSFLIDLIVIFGVQVPAMLVVTLVLDAPPNGLWACIAGANVLSAVAYALWYRKGRWKSLEV
ncbi:MAG: MATE family efflux transporter [Myxococcales bacterium]|nr:MATE family efflux transporter [Myxococcales bacterium]